MGQDPLIAETVQDLRDLLSTAADRVELPEPPSLDDLLKLVMDTGLVGPTTHTVAGRDFSDAWHDGERELGRRERLAHALGMSVHDTRFTVVELVRLWARRHEKDGDL